MKLKRVLLFTEGVWPYVMGGMQKHTFFLCRYFAKNEVEVIFVHSNQSGLNAELLENFTVEEKAYLKPVLIEATKPCPFPGHYLYESYRYSKRAYESVEQSIATVDFIIAIGLGGWYYMNKVKKTIPVAVHFHGYDFLQKQLLLYTRFQCFMLRVPFMSQHENANFIFSLGGKITELLTSNGVPINKIVTIPNAIEPGWIRNTPIPQFNCRRFVFIGRYSKTKGLDILNEVLNKLVHSHAFQMHFIGPIPEDKQVKSPDVVYHGTIYDENNIQKILQESDFLVCPSYSEGMPTVILEAMASGAAIIATDVGAVQEVVGEDIGWLIPSGNIPALYHAMESAILTDETNLRKLKTAALQKVHAYTWPAIIEKTIYEIEKRI
jgi:glycosyltransferase involved in cell wall biosynthesis